MRTLVNPQRTMEAKQTVRNMFLQRLVDLGCTTSIAQRACNKAINFLSKKHRFMLDEDGQPFNWDKPLAAYPPIIVECYMKFFVVQAHTLAFSEGKYNIANTLNTHLINTELS